jgi:pimeloyl-ACP methyl ester carboxylesterase
MAKHAFSSTLVLCSAAALGLTGCTTLGPAGLATGATLAQCAELAKIFAHERTQITQATAVAQGTVKVAGQAVAAHCLVTGRMNERVSPVDQQAYAIGFQMRLPTAWNGRFYHQGNGGLDGFVVDALGLTTGGGAVTSALQQGFAVLSSDAGHTPRQLPHFGVDPQARLDYGYQAVEVLTPMAKRLIAQAYGKAPDRSYFGGCSNGGRHALVAAVRQAEQYDGILAGNPGIHLPKAALAQLWGAQQYQKLATTPDLASAVTPPERKLLADSILQRCDALDGLKDGIVGHTAGCQQAFDLQRDVPTCTTTRDGTCLSSDQKRVLAAVFSGARDSQGQPFYSPFSYDAGVAGADWASWKFVSSITNRDPVAMAFVFQTPPEAAGSVKDPRAFAMQYDIDRGVRAIEATQGVYAQSSMAFMTPPASDLSALKKRGGKVMAYHGVSDGVFSPDDTVAWWNRLNQQHAGRADEFARLYLVPGMNHCRGGMATDQFDMLTALVAWVEEGRAPASVRAQARGAGNAGGVNTELPAAWAPDRSRPLCAYPRVAHYKAGDPERAESFECR